MTSSAVSSSSSTSSLSEGTEEVDDNARGTWGKETAARCCCICSGGAGATVKSSRSSTGIRDADGGCCAGATVLLMVRCNEGVVNDDGTDDFGK